MLKILGHFKIAKGRPNRLLPWQICKLRIALIDTQRQLHPCWCCGVCALLQSAVPWAEKSLCLIVICKKYNTVVSTFMSIEHPGGFCLCQHNSGGLPWCLASVCGILLGFFCFLFFFVCPFGSWCLLLFFFVFLLAHIVSFLSTCISFSRLSDCLCQDISFIRFHTTSWATH